MERPAFTLLIALVGAGLGAGCSAPPSAADPVEEARAALARHAGGPVEIQSLSINGDIVCGWADTTRGPFFFEDGTLVLWFDDQAPFSRCGSDFVAPVPLALPVY